MIRASDSYPQLECSRLTFQPVRTNFKWDNTKKSPQIIVYGSLDTVRTSNSNGSYEIIGNVGFTLGTSQSSWTYDIINAGSIKVGLANSIGSPLISCKMDVKELDTLKFNLGISTFSISKFTGGVRSDYIQKDITTLDGQVYYWACSVPGNRLGVKVYENISLDVELQADGSVYIGGQRLITQTTTDEQAIQLEQLQKNLVDVQISIAQIQAQLS
mgnify:CR=1 FL=1